MTTALETFSPVTNGAVETIEYSQPYEVHIAVQGTAPLLFHRWNNEAVEEKSKAAKGSKAKKQDDIESYIYRTDDGEIAIPGEYFRMAIINTARFKQDPRSPRKGAQDLFKAGVQVLTELCSLGSKNWDYLDKRRVMIQRNGITRTRPAMNTGWQAQFVLACLLPEYINPDLLYEVVAMAGRLNGVADFRPTYGRFTIVRWEPRTGL